MFRAADRGLGICVSLNPYVGNHIYQNSVFEEVQSHRPVEIVHHENMAYKQSFLKIAASILAVLVSLLATDNYARQVVAGRRLASFKIESRIARRP